MSSTITSISDVRRFFCRNQRPIYYISATNFNLQGMDEWVANFRSICHVDCFDGRHPNVFVPRERPHDPFASIEDVNNYLLRHPDVVDFVKVRGDKCGKPVAVFLMFDQRTEELCDDLGLDIWFPPAKLRQTCDNKIETVRIGEKAGVASVPNALAEVRSYQKLRAVAKKAGLGKHLVVQTAYGDAATPPSSSRRRPTGIATRLRSRRNPRSRS